MVGAFVLVLADTAAIDQSPKPPSINSPERSNRTSAYGVDTEGPGLMPDIVKSYEISRGTDISRIEKRAS